MVIFHSYVSLPEGNDRHQNFSQSFPFSSIHLVPWTFRKAHCWPCGGFSSLVFHPYRMTNSKLGWVGPIGGCWPNLTRTDCWVRPYFFQVSIPISSFSHPRSVSKHWPTTHIFRYGSHVQVSVGSPSHGLFSWVPNAGPRDLGPATGRGWKDPPYLIGGDWNMAWFFPSIGNVIIPTDELHHFSEGRYTTNRRLLLWKNMVSCKCSLEPSQW